MIQNHDIVICISKSGNSPEIVALVPLISNAGNKLVGMTGNLDSFLAKNCDFLLDTTVDSEACPNNLAPTTSTIAQMAMGDALAVALIKCRNFKSEDFAKYHPGGALGKRLYLRVNDLSSVNEKPEVTLNASLKEVIIEISEKMLGVTAVTENSKILGIITDGDLRRMLSKSDDIAHLMAKDIMGSNPKSINEDAMAVDAKEVMEEHGISQLLVEKDGKYAGVVHLHDLIKEGII